MLHAISQTANEARGDISTVKQVVETKLHSYLGRQTLTWLRERRHPSQYRFRGSRRSRLPGSRPVASLSPFCQCFCGTIGWRRRSTQPCPRKSSYSSPFRSSHFCWTSKLDSEQRASLITLVIIRERPYNFYTHNLTGPIPFQTGFSERNRR